MQMFDHTVDPSKDIARPFFYKAAQEDQRATKTNGGIPVFVDVEMVRIKIPGSRDEVDRPVEPGDKLRWGAIWEQYQKGEKQELTGIPLAEFATATAAERATLAQMGCQTVEQVAGLAGDVVSRLRLTAIKNKADQFLSIRKELANTGKLMAEIEKLQKRIGELESGNAKSTVPASDAGDGVQPSVNIPVKPNARRKKAGAVGERDGE